MKAKKLKHEFDRTLQQALWLAKSKEVSYLPRWGGARQRHSPDRRHNAGHAYTLQMCHDESADNAYRSIPALGFPS